MRRIFFFQAEGGIRDVAVTGVQTCALPICLSSAAHAAVAGDARAVALSFQAGGSFLENRGTKVDTHVHMIAFGYLALMLALFEPWVALRERDRKSVVEGKSVDLGGRRIIQK